MRQRTRGVHMWSASHKVPLLAMRPVLAALPTSQPPNLPTSQPPPPPRACHTLFSRWRCVLCNGASGVLVSNCAQRLVGGAVT